VIYTWGGWGRAAGSGWGGAAWGSMGRGGVVEGWGSMRGAGNVQHNSKCLVLF